MELRDLKCFLAVAEDLSFTRAAQRLGMAQPALSLRIRQFEAELGAPLFARTKRRVSLAQAGTALLPFARQILTSSDLAIETVRQIKAGQLGTLRIGAFYSAIYTVLPKIIRPFAAKYPSVNIEIRELIVTDQLKALRSHTIDVGVVRLERPDADLRTLDLLEEDFLCALNVNDPLAKKRAVELRDLKDAALITLDPDFNAEFYAATLAAFSGKGFSPRIVKRAPDMHLVLGLVSAGLGVALVPSSLAKIKHEHIAFRPIAAKLPRMTIRLAWLAENSSPVVRHFAEVATASHAVKSKAASSAPRNFPPTARLFRK
jgi:DNA-binding transcriptional LysR family regulator